MKGKFPINFVQKVNINSIVDALMCAIEIGFQKEADLGFRGF